MWSRAEPVLPATSLPPWRARKSCLDVPTNGRFPAASLGLPLTKPGQKGPLAAVRFSESSDATGVKTALLAHLSRRGPPAQDQACEAPQVYHAPLVLGLAPLVPPYLKVAQGFHDQIMGLCAAAGFEPRVAFHSYHPLSTIWLVSRGPSWGMQ